MHRYCIQHHTIGVEGMCRALVCKDCTSTRGECAEGVSWGECRREMCRGGVQRGSVRILYIQKKNRLHLCTGEVCKGCVEGSV